MKQNKADRFLSMVVLTFVKQMFACFVWVGYPGRPKIGQFCSLLFLHGEDWVRPGN